LVVYVVLTVYLMKKIGFLEKYIMAQKDIVAFNRVSATPVKKTKEDINKEKEQKDWDDYSKVINSGICDEKDITRFGTVTVDQG